MSDWQEAVKEYVAADPAIKDAWTWPPERMESVAWKLLVASAKTRAARMGPNDAHEIRHLYAAVTAGNTDGEEPGTCRLDHLPTDLTDPGWVPDVFLEAPEPPEDSDGDSPPKLGVAEYVGTATTVDGRPYLGEPVGYDPHSGSGL